MFENKLTDILTPSRRFLIFWLAFLIGLALGRSFSLPNSALLWLAGSWALIALSGQEVALETTALTALGISLGWLLWQATGGGVWLQAAWLDRASGLLITFRNSITSRIFTALPQPHSSLLIGIVFGNRVPLDRSLVTNFQRVGLSHVIAVSGYNLTILAANIRTLLRPLLGKKALWIVLIIILAFVLMTGAPASIIRAAIMASLAVTAELLGRPNRSINGLVLAAGLMAAFEPKIIFDIGFQLSVVATYGLIRFSPVIKPPLEKLRLPKLLADILGESFSAILLTAPLIIFYFSQFSVVSPLTNIIVLPLVPLLMGLGLIGGLLLPILPVVGGFFIQLCWPILALIVWLTGYFANLPWASLTVGWPIAAVVGALAAIFALVEYGRYRQGQVAGDSS